MQHHEKKLLLQDELRDFTHQTNDCIDMFQSSRLADAEGYGAGGGGGGVAEGVAEPTDHKWHTPFL